MALNPAFAVCPGRDVLTLDQTGLAERLTTALDPTRCISNR